MNRPTLLRFISTPTHSSKEPHFSFSKKTSTRLRHPQSILFSNDKYAKIPNSNVGVCNKCQNKISGKEWPQPFITILVNNITWLMKWRKYSHAIWVRDIQQVCCMRLQFNICTLWMSHIFNTNNVPFLEKHAFHHLKQKTNEKRIRHNYKLSEGMQ